MKAHNQHILFAGGGTAGHLFPGLAVAEHCARLAPHWQITFAGTGKRFDIRRVSEAGFSYYELPGRPFPRRASEAFRFLKDNVSGYYAARKLLREREVSLVVGLGGYASVPAARAAAALGIPIVLLEQNALPGRATRWLAPSASAVCSAFEGIGPYLRKGCRLRVTGNPLRREFVEHRVPERTLPDMRGKQRTLLVLGGSGGAQILNQQVPLAIYKASGALANWRIVHQTGERQRTETAELYRKLGIEATVMPFITNLPALLRSSHLAISRAGGTTLAELSATGVPAILLPFPQAADDHQRKNADVYEAAGACRTLDERELDGRIHENLAATVAELATGHALRVRMAHAISRLARLDATVRVTKAMSLALQRVDLAMA